MDHIAPIAQTEHIIPIAVPTALTALTIHPDAPIAPTVPIIHRGAMIAKIVPMVLLAVPHVHPNARGHVNLNVANLVQAHATKTAHISAEQVVTMHVVINQLIPYAQAAIELVITAVLIHANIPAPRIAVMGWLHL